MVRKSAKVLSMNARCTKVFTVDGSFHLRVRQLMRDALEEHGGDVIINFDSNIILPASTQVGKYNKVNLRRGVVDWHTHPGRCLSDSVCTIGLPSPADMANIVIGVSMGTLAHMVYSREGTYLVQMTNSMRARVLASPSFQKAKINQVLQAFEHLYQVFNKVPHETFHAVKSVPVPYSVFRRKFIELGVRHGFNIKFFRGNTVPKFRLFYNCEATKAGPGLVADMLE